MELKRNQQKKKKDKNLKFYQDGATEYIEQTLNLEMTPLNNFMSKHIETSNVVLDLGFGSGRELKTLRKQGIKTIGIDMTPDFVEAMKQSGEEVYLSKLPQIKIPEQKIDVAYSIAVLFHLNEKDRKKLYKNLKKTLSEDGKLILSYNTEDRRKDETRYFDKLTKEQIKLDLEKEGFKLIDQELMPDKLDRGWEWVTECYQLKK